MHFSFSWLCAEARFIFVFSFKYSFPALWDTKSLLKRYVSPIHLGALERVKNNGKDRPENVEASQFLHLQLLRFSVRQSLS